MAKQTKASAIKSTKTSKAKAKKSSGQLKDKDLDPVRGGVRRRVL